MQIHALFYLFQLSQDDRGRIGTNQEFRRQTLPLSSREAKLSTVAVFCYLIFYGFCIPRVAETQSFFLIIKTAPY